MFVEQSQAAMEEEHRSTSCWIPALFQLLLVLGLATWAYNYIYKYTNTSPRFFSILKDDSRNKQRWKESKHIGSNVSMQHAERSHTKHIQFAKLESATAVISVATGYPWVRYATFLLPLRVHYKGDIILLGEPPNRIAPDVRQLCDEQGVSIEVLRVKACDASAIQCPEVVTARFRQIAAICRRGYTLCLSTDFRDVFFQGNPFATLLFTSWTGQASASPLLRTHDLVLRCAG